MVSVLELMSPQAAMLHNTVRANIVSIVEVQTGTGSAAALSAGLALEDSRCLPPPVQEGEGRVITWCGFYSAIIPATDFRIECRQLEAGNNHDLCLGFRFSVRELQCGKGSSQM